MTSDDAVDVLHTIMLWRDAGLTPAEAYEALLGVAPKFGLRWSDVQDVAKALRERLPSHEPTAGAQIIRGNPVYDNNEADAIALFDWARSQIGAAA